MFDVCMTPWVERGQEWLQEFGQAAGRVEFPPTEKGKATGGTGRVRDIRSSALHLLILRCALHQVETLSRQLNIGVCNLRKRSALEI